MRKGVFITFEGPEGSGKSTQSKLIYRRLKRLYSCVLTREPGGTRLGDRIRKVLLHSEGVKISDLAELFLFEAARSQIVREVIAPALAQKKIVICDRFSDATFSYQGYGGLLRLDLIEKLDRIATAGIRPELTILLDVDTVKGLRRAGKKGVDRMEKKDLSYHRRVRAGYLKRAKAEPHRIKVVRVTESIEKVQAKVWREVERVIQRYKGSG